MKTFDEALEFLKTPSLRDANGIIIPNPAWERYRDLIKDIRKHPGTMALVVQIMRSAKREYGEDVKILTGFISGIVVGMEMEKENVSNNTETTEPNR